MDRRGDGYQYWLSELLPDTVPNCRILAYGYDVDTRGPTLISVQSLFEHAKALAEDLWRERRGIEVSALDCLHNFFWK
jgi:hypothetical protein